MGTSGPLIGVLALQGAFAAHERTLTELGARTAQVRTPADLKGVDALVMPGGESTTMSRLVTTSGMTLDLHERLHGGLAVFGTCAGMILLANDVLDGRADQVNFGVLDASVRRNAYGRQVDSFETDITVDGLDRPFHAVFIRAPVVEAVGPSVRVLSEVDGHPVLVRQGPVLAASFHPELAGDARLHARFLQEV